MPAIRSSVSVRVSRPSAPACWTTRTTASRSASEARTEFCLLGRLFVLMSPWSGAGARLASVARRHFGLRFPTYLERQAGLDDLECPRGQLLQVRVRMLGPVHDRRVHRADDGADHDPDVERIGVAAGSLADHRAEHPMRLAGLVEHTG